MTLKFEVSWQKIFWFYTIWISECIYWYYESRRRVLLDSQPNRVQRKAENDKRTRVTQRQRAVSFFRSNAAGLHHKFIACLKNFSMGMSVPNPPGHGPQSIIFSTFMTKHYCLHQFFCKLFSKRENVLKDAKEKQYWKSLYVSRKFWWWRGKNFLQGSFSTLEIWW